MLSPKQLPSATSFSQTLAREQLEYLNNFRKQPLESDRKKSGPLQSYLSSPNRERIASPKVGRIQKAVNKPRTPAEAAEKPREEGKLRRDESPFSNQSGGSNGLNRSGQLHSLLRGQNLEKRLLTPVRLQKQFQESCIP